MAKSQKRSGREPKKPKTAVKKASQAASLFTDDSRMGKKPPRVTGPPPPKPE
ncbi:hypothetical protein [Magnetospirillum sp. XM-1]|uniref:hypothetical protein n=1 Tax=Magnetospirillum sp. XM-1 TaxID=1663591 RepID=UPI000A4BFF67|nr:hypothetical protein [Magnetospirillum sp. XM-1]